VACSGQLEQYSLANECQNCPDGADCTKGHFNVRLKAGEDKESGLWIGHPFYMSCVSNKTLRTLEALGVNASAYVAAGVQDADEQANMGGPRDQWKCESSTMISSSKSSRVLGTALVYVCPNSAACIVQAGGTPDCLEGYWGPVCAWCEEGYAWSEGHLCEECEPEQNTLPWSVGAAVAIAAAGVVAYYIGVTSPLFENDDGVGPCQRAVAWASQRWARWRPARPPPTDQPIANPIGSHGPDVQETVEAVQGIYETLASYWEHISGIMEFSDEKQGAMARCLIGFSQVPSRKAHTW
jgi:hypothetical protein